MTMTTPSSTMVLASALLVVALVSAGASAAEAAPGDSARRELSLSPGEQRTLPGEGVDALSTSTPGIVDVRITDDQKQILVVALAPGVTTLLLMMKNGTRLEYQINVARIRARRNIRLDLYVVQIERRRGLQLGVLWPGSLGATVAAQAVVDNTRTYTGNVTVTSQIIPQIDFARNKGWAKVVDQARIVTANGEEGRYSSGGEINVRVAEGLGADLEKIVFGTSITSRASYDEVTGRIEGHIKAEVSKITSTSVDGIPGLARVQVETAINLELGQSLAVGGLFADDEQEEMRGLPLLSEIPIIGYFFGSKGFRQQHFENVIFIVPTLVGAAGLEQRDRVAEAFRIYREYEGDTDEEKDFWKLGQDTIIRPTPSRPDRQTGEAVGPGRPANGKRRAEAP